jgi:aryl-alcohol dehydrogenase-like predicted oxidoreductase
LGKAIKKFNLPRDEIVILTKVSALLNANYFMLTNTIWQQVFFPVSDVKKLGWTPGSDPAEIGFVNQVGLSRKVCPMLSPSPILP